MGVAILGVMMVKGGAPWVYPRHLWGSRASIWESWWRRQRNRVIRITYPKWQGADSFHGHINRQAASLECTRPLGLWHQWLLPDTPWFRKAVMDNLDWQSRKHWSKPSQPVSSAGLPSLLQDFGGAAQHSRPFIFHSIMLFCFSRNASGFRAPTEIWVTWA